MNRSRRIKLWICGTVVVCLLLFGCLVWQFRKGPGRKQVVADSARSGSIAERPTTPIPLHHEPRPIGSSESSAAATNSRLRPQARAAQHPLESKQASATLLVSFPEARPQVVAPPQPKKITLEPLGYAQKADGRVEAIISQGEHVQVVHEGEIVEDNFRVAKISASAVELVENTAPPTASPLAPEIGQSVAQAPAGKPPQMPPRPVPDLVSNTGANRQFAVDSPARGSQPSLRQDLGYVERADGRVEAIVADGEHVRLTPETKSFARNFYVPEPSPADLEAENEAPSAINPPDSVARESQPAQPNSFAQKVGEPPLVASRTETSTLPEAQGLLRNHGGSESEPRGIIQPEPLADYSVSRLESREAASGAHAGLAGVAPSPGTPSSGQALKAGAKPSLPSGGKGTQSALLTLGYVEKANGEKEAIVEFLGQVYLVHEGELFAEKYRVLQVTSSSVKIVEESTKGSSLPSEIERHSEAVRPAIPRLRAPPLSAGFSGTDPPLEVRKAEELVAGEPVVSPSSPPPEHSVESWQTPKGLEGRRTALKSVHSAEWLAQTGTRSPPCALLTVGFVEKASGETEAIVAEEGGVYLVYGRRVALDTPKIPNLLPADVQSARESSRRAKGGSPSCLRI